MVLLTIAAVTLAAVMIWVAASAAAEEDLRARRGQRREALRDLAGVHGNDLTFKSFFPHPTSEGSYVANNSPQVADGSC
jgi:hypothetical protein